MCQLETDFYLYTGKRRLQSVYPSVGRTAVSHMNIYVNWMIPFASIAMIAAITKSFQA